MSFTSYRFIVFAGATLAAYNLVPRRYRLPLLLLASVLFYADASLPHLMVLCVVAMTTYASALLVARHHGLAVLTIAVMVVGLPLLFFKYSSFLLGLTSPGDGYALMSVVGDTLPIGISFFTFQAVAYIVDVYRGAAYAERRPDRVYLYLAFFPKLLAGPIERARNLLPQLQVLDRSTARNVYGGLKVILWGFFCKLVVADNLGLIVDPSLKALQDASGATLSVVFGLYGFQIYFDFLGYTNIAIGVALLFNIHLTHNFNVPYGATSLRAFWRRWHISLSSWFRDYVYIPLGGSTTRGVTRLGHVLLVFFLSGLWHGAALNFVVWGLFHGVAYWSEDQLRTRIRWPRWASSGALRALQPSAQRVLTFVVVTVGWVFFRLSDLTNVRVALERMAGVNVDVAYTSLNPLLTRADSVWFIVILSSAIVFDSSRSFRAFLEHVPESSRQVIRELAYVNWLVLALALLGDLGVRDFAYVRF